MEVIYIKERAACFTGHRTLLFTEKRKIEKRTEQLVIDAIAQGYQFFYAGGALGFDTLAAQIVLKLKKKYPHIKLILVLPYHQEIDIPCDECICLAEKYKKGCFHIRNRYLVEHSNYCVCYLTENRGGTFYTVNYAQKQGLEIHNINDKSTKKV